MAERYEDDELTGRQNRYESTDSKWIKVLGDNHNEHSRYLKEFLIFGIHEFLADLRIRSFIASGMAPDNERDREFCKNFQEVTRSIASFGGSGISGLTNIVLAICNSAAKSYQLNKAKNIVNVLAPDNQRSKQIIAIVICDICRIFEHQIISMGTTGSNANIKLFAKTIVSRALKYIAYTGNKKAKELKKEIKDNDDKIFIEDMAKHLIFGVFRGSSGKWDNKYLSFKDKDDIYQKCTCGDIITQLGIAFGDMKNSADVYYFKNQSEKYISKFGYRRSSVYSSRIRDEYYEEYLPLDSFAEESSYCHCHLDKSGCRSLGQMYSDSKITDIKDIEGLLSNAKDILEVVLLEDSDYFTEKMLNHIAAKMDVLEDLITKADQNNNLVSKFLKGNEI